MTFPIQKLKLSETKSLYLSFNHPLTMSLFPTQRVRASFFSKGMFLLLSLLLLGTAACQNKNASGANPDFKAEFTDLNSRKSNLSDYQGKTVVLHFWATWCKPCIEEFPSLKAAQPRLEKENVQLLIASDEDLALIEKFQDRFETGLNLAQLSQGSLAEFEVYALPTTIILDSEGKEIHRISGKIDWSSISSIDQLTQSSL